MGLLRIADRDTVELSNLNRQVLHWEENIGDKKVVSASAKLGRLNPDIKASKAPSPSLRRFSTGNGMKTTTMATLAPDLKVCTTTTGSSPSTCASAATTVVSNAVVVIYSMGKDWGATPVTTEEQENQGTTLGGGPSSVNYPVANDIVFVDTDYNNSSGSEFDDLLSWLSPNILYNRMVAGGRLP